MDGETWNPAFPSKVKSVHPPTIEALYKAFRDLAESLLDPEVLAEFKEDHLEIWQ